jgi:hypothetical protein
VGVVGVFLYVVEDFVLRGVVLVDSVHVVFDVK